MNRPRRFLHAAPAVMALLILVSVTVASAQDVGQVKISRGAVHIERAGESLPAPVGAKVRAADVIVTGADGSVGVTFADDSLLSLGPRSVLAIDRFIFDSTTHGGSFDASLRKGTLTAVSGKLARESGEAMRVRTPVAILGVRGTELVVRTGTPAD